MTGMAYRAARAAHRRSPSASFAMVLSMSASAFAATPNLSADSFSADFSAMAQLKPLVAQGKGKIGVLLPETTTSARYTSFDAPYLEEGVRGGRACRPTSTSSPTRRAASRPS